MNIYSQICNPVNLNLAYAQIRTRVKKQKLNQLAIADYEGHLELNLEDLAARLCEGRYYSVSTRLFESAYNSFSQTMRIIEDQIAQRAAFNAISPLFEPVLIDCSFGPHRNTEARAAVRQALEHRAMGDNYIVRADISEGFSGFDYDNLIYLLDVQINDQRMLRLIRMWLVCGLDLFEKIGHGGCGGSDDRGVGEDGNPRDFRSELKRFGIDTARITFGSSLLALASNHRYRQIFTKRNIALAASAALAAAAYPAVSQLLRERLAPERSQRIPESSVVLSEPLASLMADVALHPFDVAMTGAGWRMVRYCDRFAITASRETDAYFAIEQAARELRRMDIELKPHKVCVTRFDEGVEFLGYRIHKYENSAELIDSYKDARFDYWRQRVTDAINQPPADAGIGGLVISAIGKEAPGT